MQRMAPQPSTKPSGDKTQESDASCKGVISVLQEFVQCSRQFSAPQHRPILQWSFDSRMTALASLEFRGTVAFLLDGVPHHIAGTWHPSKKFAQRDTADRALAFFVGRWGEQLLSEHKRFGEPKSDVSKTAASDVQVLEDFCRSSSSCAGAAPKWSSRLDERGWSAQAEMPVLGVLHKFAGVAKGTEDAAMEDVARRVLWYLQCPGYEDAFAPDAEAPAVTAKEIPAPPAYWASDEAEGQALQMAERKTALMRVQNRLQQEFARRLRVGQSVWEWSFETDEQDQAWPPLCRATVVVPLMGRQFTGGWARGQRDAQLEAVSLLGSFIDNGGLSSSDDGCGRSGSELAC